VPLKKAFKIRLAYFKEIADIKSEKSGKKEKDNNEDVGNGRAEVSCDLPFHDDSYVSEKVSVLHWPLRWWVD
jgi:hypothetical protein